MKPITTAEQEAGIARAKAFIIEYYKDQDDLTPYIDNAFWSDNARRMEEYAQSLSNREEGKELQEQGLINQLKIKNEQIENQRKTIEDFQNGLAKYLGVPPYEIAFFADAERFLSPSSPLEQKELKDSPPDKELLRLTKVELQKLSEITGETFLAPQEVIANLHHVNIAGGQYLESKGYKLPKYY